MEMDEEPVTESAEAKKLPAIAHLMCGWPLVLVFVGGAIGGGLGGAAYGVNTAIYKSQMPVVAKVTLNILTGIAAVGIWIAVVTALQLGFPR